MLLLTPLSVMSQVGFNASDPISPLNLLDDLSDSRRYFQVSYCSPYGIPSLSNMGLRLNQPLSRGRIAAETSWSGIPGYYQYSFGLGYMIAISPGIITGVYLNAVLLPSFQSFPRRISPGSSLFAAVNAGNKLSVSVFVDNWTGLWTNWSGSWQHPRFSAIMRLKIPDNFIIVSGLSYPKGGKVLGRLGVSVLAGADHTIMAGVQSSPVGFWIGYRFTHKQLDFLFTIQAGGVFGYEPGTSLKFLMN